jgi:intein/homing endonuclease
MATWELQLVSRIVRTGDLNTAVQWGITLNDFLTAEGHALYSSLLGYYSAPGTTGSILGPQAVQQTFPNFILCDDPSMTMEALCFEVRKARLSLEFKTKIQGALELADYDPMAAVNKTQTAMIDLQNVGFSRQTDVHFYDAYSRVVRKMEMLEQGIDMSCGRWPWDPLQEVTGGVQPDDFVILYGRPKNMKCIPVDEPVLRWDGTFTTITELSNSVTLNHQAQCWVRGEVVHHTKPRPMECFEIVTESGHRARLGVTHPLLRPNLEYTPCGNIEVGDWVGVARYLPDFPAASDGLDLETAELLGLLVGDGNYTRNEVQFTSENVDVLQRVERLIATYGCSIHRTQRPIEFRIVGTNGKNGVLDLLRSEGIHGHKSAHKYLPEKIFRSGKEAILAILGGLLSTDGHVASKKCFVAWNTSSLKLARQIKHLLLRLGIVARLESAPRKDAEVAHRVIVGTQEQQSKLLPILPYVSAKYKARALLNGTARKLKNKRDNDRIPWSKDLEEAIHAARPKATNGNPNGGWPHMWHGFSSHKLFRRSGCISRKLLRRLAEALNAPQLLKWADSCISWERVVQKNPIGVLLTADAGVVEHHNFLVGDLITHNTWVLAFLIAWFHDMGKRMVIYTKEMTADNIFMRAGACLAQVRYHEFRVAPWGLSWEEKQAIYAVQKILRRAQEDQTVVCLSGKDAAEGGDTVPWLRSKVEMYKPDIVFVDGMYLMTDAKGNKKPNEKVGSISNDLRAMTLATHIPVIATIQANREAAKNKEANLDEIGFSDRVGQDATLLMRCINEKDKPTVALVMGGASREFQLNGFRIYGVPATNFNYAGEISDKEIEKAKEGDVADDEAGNSKKTPAAKKATKGPTEGNAAATVIRKANRLL